MSGLMIVETGELVEQMTTEEASSVTTQISVKLDAIADNYESVMPLIRAAITRQAHIALGYASPGAYVADRFGRSLSRLGVDMRRQVVRELSEAGLSTRAIAPVVGVSHVTVSHDQRSGVNPFTPAPESVAPVLVDHVTGEVLGDEDDDEPVPAYLEPEPVAPTPVTGIDGKRYTAPAARKPARKPLIDVAKSRGFALRESADSVVRIFTDDRIRTNEKQVADVLRGHLLYVAETVAAVLDQLP